MSGLLGALAGAGEAFQDVADRRLKQYDDARLEQMRQQAEIMKEQRAEESAKRLGLFREEMDIRGENRKITNDALVRKQKMDEETDPEYIKRLATAETTKQGLLDAYKYGNADQEAAYKRKMALASDIDHTDYAGRALQHQLIQAKIAKLQSGEGGEAFDPRRYEVKTIQDENGVDRIIRVDKATGQGLDITDEMKKQVMAEKDAEGMALRQAFLGNENKGVEKISREQLIRDLEKKYPNFDVRSSVANMSDTEITQKFEKSLREDEASSLKANQEKKKAVQDKQKAFEKQKEKDRRLESAARAEKKGSRYFGRRDSEY